MTDMVARTHPRSAAAGAAAGTNGTNGTDMGTVSARRSGSTVYVSANGVSALNGATPSKVPKTASIGRGGRGGYGGGGIRSRYGACSKTHRKCGIECQWFSPMAAVQPMEATEEREDEAAMAALSSITPA